MLAFISEYLLTKISKNESRLLELNSNVIEKLTK